MCRCHCALISPGFAESSWHGNHEETSLSHIPCNGQLQISHPISLCLYVFLTLSLIWAYSRALSLSTLSIVCFHFDLHEKHPHTPSVQSAFLHLTEDGMSRAAQRTAPSIFRIMISFFQSTTKVTN